MKSNLDVLHKAESDMAALAYMAGVARAYEDYHKAYQAIRERGTVEDRQKAEKIAERRNAAWAAWMRS